MTALLILAILGLTLLIGAFLGAAAVLVLGALMRGGQFGEERGE